MVRLSKQKQEKLENIMNLVEELGVDRVLARLRQTKMMSKEVLDDMKVRKLMQTNFKTLFHSSGVLQYCAHTSLLIDEMLI